MFSLLRLYKKWTSKRNGTGKTPKITKRLTVQQVYEYNVAAFKKALAESEAERHEMKRQRREMRTVPYSIADNLYADLNLQKNRMSAAISKLIENEGRENSSECEYGGDVRTIPERLEEIVETLAEIGGQLLDRGGQVPEDLVGVGIQLANIGMVLAAGPGYRPSADDMVADGLPRDQGKDEDEVKEGCFAQLLNCCLNYYKPYDVRAPSDLYY